MIVCPNFSNPDVAREFEELKAATSEKAAYAIWSLNNGNAIDKAPNGAQSKLFQDLLQYFNGDRTQAIRAKAKVYSSSFIQWFGDWVAVDESHLNTLEIVNKDGSINFDKLEELSNKYFKNADESLFNKGRKTLRERQEHHNGESNTLEHIQNVVKSAQESNISNNLKQQVVIAAALHDLAKPFHAGNKHGFQSEELLDKIFKGKVSGLARFAIAHHMMTIEEGQEFTRDDAERIVNDAINRNLDVNEAVDVLIALHIADITRGRNLEDIDEYSNKSIREVINTEVENKRKLLKEVANTKETNSVSKVVDENGEPLIDSVILPYVKPETTRADISTQEDVMAQKPVYYSTQESKIVFLKNIVKKYLKHRDFKLKGFKPLYCIFSPKNVVRDHYSEETLKQQFKEAVEACGGAVEDFNMKQSQYNPQELLITSKKTNFAAQKRQYQKPQTTQGEFESGQSLMASPEEIALSQSITHQMYNLGVQIDNERHQYVNSVLNQYKVNNPNASQTELARVLNSARHQFNVDRSKRIMRENQTALAQMFGLTMNRSGYFESSETTQKKLMYEFFINSLQESTFKAYNLDNLNRTKYQQVGVVENATSLANLLYNSIYDGDLVTLDKALARDYVRMFWGSDLIQSALKSLDNGSKTASQLEEDLVSRMTRNPANTRNTNIISWFQTMWQNLSQLVKQVFSGVVFTDQQKSEILRAVDAAFMLAEDLYYTNNNNVIYDRIDGKYDTSELLSEKDKQILSDIKQGTKTRLKSQLSRNVKNQKLIADLKSRLEIMEGKNEDSIDDVYDIIQDFLVTANSEINKTRNYIDRILLIPGNMENWNPQEINFIQQDLIGFYKNLLFTIYDLFNDETSAINKFNKIRVQSDPNAIDLKNFSKELQKTVEGLQTDYNSYVVKPYVRMVLTNYVEEDNAVTDKQTFIYNMERWLEQDFAYGDLAAGEVIIGMASRSKSPIVRIVEHMASAAEYAAHRQVLSKGHELVRLYNRVRPTGSQISPYNWQKRFMEFDKDGIPTGYFIREVNAGQFYLDKDAEEERLRLKYGLERDEDGNIIFNDQDLRANDSVYNKFNDELDEWLDKHCHRRYTLDYYKARRRFLSPNTLIAQGRIQRQIDLVLDKCRMPSGFIDLSKLTISERRQLDILRKQKRDLGSHYIFTEDPDTGILHVENKVGEALQMADEITAWNKHIAERVKYKPNWDAFNEAKQQLIDSGASQQEVDDFIRNNTTTRITSEFYDTLRTAVGKSATTPELENLKRRHSEILNAIKERQGAGSHNLNKLGVGLNTDRSGWIELQRLEQRMAEIKHDLAARGIKGIPGDGSLTFDQLATTLYVTTGDQSNESYLMYLINQWRNAAASGTNMQNVFNQLFTFKDEKGRIRYLNAFKYLTPLDFTLDINGRIIHCIESLPGTEYSELDESSDYVNEKFQKDGPSMQPKAYDDNGSRLYKSEAYEKLSSGEIQFLNALKATMEEANDMIPNKAVSRDELLPQISGRTMTVLANSIMGKEWSTALSYPFRKFGVKYAETEDDVSTNTDLARRPDGTVVNNIPIRFINRLSNRATQSTDVLGSVIMYYDMACNYASKSKNLPTLELIKFAIDPARNTNQHQKPEQYKKVENILDQRYYGKETSFGFSSDEKITPAKQRVIQSTKAIRNFAAVAMLGINFTTIEVGYIDAMCSMLADGIAGKYITLEDMRVALIDCIKHTPKVLAGLGNPVVNDKLVAAMQYNNLSRSNSDIFSSTDQFKVDRFVREHLLMGGYTLTDYMVNGLMLRATYNTYRLIADPKTSKWAFYSKSDAINEFTKLGYTEKQAVKLWNKSAVTLWDAYDCIDGDFVVKDQYKDIITKKLEDRISGRLRDRTAMYNGIIPITDRAKVQQNVFGSFLTLMRNFYVNTYWDRFKTGGDYVTQDGDHSINWRSEYQRDDLGMVNFETGEFEGAVFKDFARGMYKLTTNAKSVIIGSQHNKLTREQKYAVTRCVTELIMIGSLLFLMLWSVAFARSNNYDDDKEPVWTLNLIGDGPLLDIKPNHVEEKFMDFLRWKLALLATRGFTERLTSWWAPTVLELFTSPSTATSYLDDIGVMWGFIIDLFSQRADEKIKTGGYKHMTRGTRDLLKLFSPLGVDNLVRSWHTDGIKSTFNFYRKLAPTNAIVPSQQEWNEQHGLGKHGATGEKKKSRKKKFKEFE